MHLRAFAFGASGGCSASLTGRRVVSGKKCGRFEGMEMIVRFRNTRKMALVLLCTAGLFLMLFSMNVSAKGRKRFAILGDSYSAYYGMIPKGYECSYAIKGKDGENKWPNNINHVSQMWWYRLIKTGRYKMTVNCSYSGSCFGYIYKGGKSHNRTSYLCRMRKYLNGKRTKADIIFVQGGTNDSWRKKPIGKVKFEKWTKEDLRKALPSFSYILNYLKKKYPKAEIVVLINDKYICPRLVRGMQSACAYYQVPYIMLGNISTQSRHPDKKGQKQIYRKVSTFLNGK